MNNYEQHFASLKVYYQAEQYEDSSSSSLLYFILKKVDLGIALNDLEYSWLRENNLFNSIKCAENKSEYSNQFVIEANRLFQKYLPTVYAAYSAGLTKELLSNPIHFLLKKLEMCLPLTPGEIKYLNSHGYPRLVTLAEFLVLKGKYQATEFPDTAPSSPLFSILKQLDIQGPLSIQEIEWLQSQSLPQVFAIFVQQEHSRNLQFTALKEKYYAGDYSDTSYLSRPLYEILQQLDAHKPVSELQLDWLKQQKLVETLVVVEEQKFEALKQKYKATALQESSISSHLYKVLKKVDAGESLSEPDVNFLNKRKLVSTLAIYVQMKIERDQVLTEIEYNWLVQNRQGNEILGKDEIFRYLVSKKLEEGKRLDEIEAVWLYDKFKPYQWTDQWTPYCDLWIRYQEIEALFYENEYKNTGNKWNLANASSHWRKAEKPKSALAVTDELNFAKIKEDKLKAALLTTRGGAFRDLPDLDQAETCAMQAIQYYPKSHHPYTLMGAICFERGQYGEGHEWFEQAIQRGASPRDHDAELKRIVRDTKDPKKRRELIDYLLKKDSGRYGWAKEYLPPRKQ